MTACTQKAQPPLPLPSADEPAAEAVFSPGSMTASLGYATSAVLQAPDGATRIGMLLDLRASESVARISSQIEVRGFDANGSPTEWIPASTTWSEENYLVARADVGHEIFGAQLRLPASNLPDVANITFAAVVPEINEAPPSQKASQFATAQAGLSIPDHVKTRAQWGARPTKCWGSNTKKYRMAIHHTFTPPKSGGSYEARIRGIQAYHMDTRGWCDVGYHFLVTDDGHVYEGRPLHFNGAHVGGHNTGNIGISFVGCYQSGACDSMGTMYPSNASINGTAKLIRALSDQFGISIDSSKIKGHGQHDGAYTACPGDRILKEFTTIFELAKGNQPSSNSEPPASVTGRAVGVVWDRSITENPADQGNVRLAAANVSANGNTVGVKDGSAYWEIILPVGIHTLTAVAPGYEAAAKTIEISPGKETWASVGLVPTNDAESTPQDGTVTVEVIDSQGLPVRDSAVHLHDVQTKTTNDVAMAGFPLKAGQKIQITAYGSGLQARTVSHSVTGDELIQIALEPETKDYWTGTVQGVVWDESITTSPNASGNQRIDNAMILCSNGKSRSARTSDAFWSFTLAAGEYTFTAVAPGYIADSKTVSIGWGSQEWGSIGLTPQ